MSLTYGEFLGKLTSQQQVAVENPCRMAFETAHPRFMRKDLRLGFSCNLTINSGYE
jgi:hypothetical protein